MRALAPPQPCRWCHKPFQPTAWNVAHGRGFFCSHRCVHAAKRSRVPKGYKEQGHRRLHVQVAEQALGHPLPPSAEVHHFNENKHDNRPSNLVICQDHAYHCLLHVRARVKRAGGDPNLQRMCSVCRMPCLFADIVRRRNGQFTNHCRTCASRLRNEWNASQKERATA